jgi:hypothetical protein
MAATSFWARLVWAAKTLDLNAEPFILGADFNPPSIGRSVEFANDNSGGIGHTKRIKENYQNRSWTFSVRILGKTEEAVNGYVNELSTFIELARNSNSKLYLEYYPHNTIGYIPLWGQGVYRYLINDGWCAISSPWNVRDDLAIVSVNLTIAPYAEGSRQRLAYAKGMVVSEITQIAQGGISGLSVGSSGTNLVTNPIFSNETAWNTGWGSAGDWNIIKNTDNNYVLFGDTSVRLDTIDDADTGKFTTSITVGTVFPYCLSCYVKKADETAPGTKDIQFYYDGSAPANLGTFESMSIGNGWYRIYDYVNIPGTATGYSFGVSNGTPGASIYVDGFQVETTGTALTDTPGLLAYGDLPGVTWDGTRGSATSTAEAGALYLPVTDTVDSMLSDARVINQAAGCIRMAVKWDANYTDSSTMNFFNAGTAFRAYYAPSLDRIVFDACGTTAVSGTQNFAAGDIYVYHFGWGRPLAGDENAGKVSIHVNGVLSGTVDSYTNNALETRLFIASNSAYTNPLKGAILDFTIWEQGLIQSKRTADYEQLIYTLRDSAGNPRQHNTIPYISTRGGGGTVEAYYDATHQDYAVIGNIPGNLPARTIFDVALSLGGTADAGLVMSNHTYVHYIDKANEFWTSNSAQNVGTATVTYPAQIEIKRDWSAYRGQKLYMACALTEGSGTVNAYGRERITYSSGVNAYYSEWVTMPTTASTEQWWLLGPINIPESMPSEYDWMNAYKELNYDFQLKRPAGSGTITLDFYRMLVGQTMYVRLTGMNGATAQSMIIDGNNVYSYHTIKEDGFRVLYGDAIEFEPGRYNHLIALPINIGRTVEVDDKVVFNRVFVVPRYALL